MFNVTTVKGFEEEDGTFLVSGEDSTIQKIKVDYEKSTIVDSFYGSSKGIRMVELSRDHKQLVSSCMDHSLRVWDYKTCQALKSLAGHQDAVTGGTFLNKDTIASCSWDTRIMIWKI